ncbi:transposase [Endozoicomonas sp. YOMI1]|uniref:transposase n=1 Tax=Endozoicomonas sp. YOMI1 TaxID=2828739 RepID=UPI0021494DAC|nr:transposase [Endozoicomonas sp. YOMI1]
MARGDFNSGDQFIAFFGLDLQFKDSGTKHGRRRLGKGRRLLYNVAMSACRGAFKPMTEALRGEARGEPAGEQRSRRPPPEPLEKTTTTGKTTHMGKEPVL